MEKVEETLRLSRQAVFDSLVREYGESVIRLVYLIVKDKSAAEDITQEAFFRAYKGLDSFRGDAQMKTWLYRIAVNEAKKHLRRRSIRHLFAAMTGKNEQRLRAVPSVDAETAVLRKMNEQDVLNLVGSLPPAYREVITLHYYEGLSVREAAYVLNLSEEAVRVRLYRARQQLKQRMEEEGFTWM